MHKCHSVNHGRLFLTLLAAAVFMPPCWWQPWLWVTWVEFFFAVKDHCCPVTLRKHFFLIQNLYPRNTFEFSEKMSTCIQGWRDPSLQYWRTVLRLLKTCWHLKFFWDAKMPTLPSTKSTMKTGLEAHDSHILIASMHGSMVRWELCSSDHWWWYDLFCV